MDPSEAGFVEQVAAALRPHLPAELAAGQSRFCAALARAHRRVNLTAITGPRQMAVLHVLDSLTALAVLDGEGPLVDLGSGGGLPGIPLALALPRREVVLVESRARKAAALAELVAELGLAPRVAVAGERGEHWLARTPVDTVVTRAVGSVEEQLRLLAPVRHHFRRLVLMKGPAADAELERARRRMEKGGWPPPRRHETELPDGAGRRVLLVFEGAAGAGPSSGLA